MSDRPATSGRRGIDDRRDVTRAAFARRRGRPPERALDPLPVASLERDPFASDRPVRGERCGEHRRIELVICRGREPAGATAGTGSSHRSWGCVSLSPIAASQAPSAVQPTARQTPGPGLTTWPAPTATVGGGFLGGRPRPRFTGVTPPIGVTTTSTRASWTSMWRSDDRPATATLRSRTRHSVRRAPANPRSGLFAPARRRRDGRPGTSRRHRSGRESRRPPSPGGPPPIPCARRRPSARRLSRRRRGGSRRRHGPEPGT